MIHINKPIVYSGITIAFAALALTGLGMKEVEAVSFSPTEIVSRIAKRFNLNQDDVQAVYSSFREERRSQMLKDRETKLDESVKTGKLTEMQKIIDQKGNNLSGRLLEKHPSRTVVQWFVSRRSLA